MVVGQVELIFQASRFRVFHPERLEIAVVVGATLYPWPSQSRLAHCLALTKIDLLLHVEVDVVVDQIQPFLL